MATGMTCIQPSTFHEPSCVQIPTIGPHASISGPQIVHVVSSSPISHLAFTGADIETLFGVGLLAVVVGLLAMIRRRHG